MCMEDGSFKSSYKCDWKMCIVHTSDFAHLESIKFTGNVNIRSYSLEILRSDIHS